MKTTGNMVYVYFIRGKITNRIKIGSSANVNRRLYDLSTSSPDDLELLGVLVDNGNTENEIHDKFKKFRLHGEWFEADESILTFVHNNTTMIDAKPQYEFVERRKVRRQQRRVFLENKELMRRKESELELLAETRFYKNTNSSRISLNRVRMYELENEIIGLSLLTGQACARRYLRILVKDKRLFGTDYKRPDARSLSGMQ
jgi:hypothetical protein